MPVDLLLLDLLRQQLARLHEAVLALAVYPQYAAQGSRAGGRRKPLTSGQAPVLRSGWLWGPQSGYYNKCFISL